MVEGGRMSKSIGNVVTLEEMLETVPPEIVRYVLVRTDPNKHKDFDWAKIPQLVGEFERIERIYFGLEEPAPREDPGDLRRIYELSLVRPEAAQELHQVPYGHLVTLVQLYPAMDDMLEALYRSGELDRGLGDEHLDCIRTKARNARAWVERYADENQRIKLLEELDADNRAQLPQDQRAYLARLGQELETTPWEGGAIQDVVFNLSKEMGLKARDAFGAIYRAFLGRQRGPRAGFFLASLDRDWVLARLLDAGK
jgi:lysyl-tRNA synthetase class 1